MKYKNQQVIERLRDEFGTREFINAPREELEQFLDEQLEKKNETIKELSETIKELVMKYNPEGYALYKLEQHQTQTKK